MRTRFLALAAATALAAAGAHAQMVRQKLDTDAVLAPAPAPEPAPAPPPRMVGRITHVVGPSSARLSPEGRTIVVFHVSGDEPNVPMVAGECGYSLWVDDGAARAEEKHRDEGLPVFPKRVSKVFDRPGRYAVSVMGAGESGCEGGASTEIVIEPAQ